jgi:hypothetical protein
VRSCAGKGRGGTNLILAIGWNVVRKSLRVARNRSICAQRRRVLSSVRRHSFNSDVCYGSGTRGIGEKGELGGVHDVVWIKRRDI